MAHAEKVEEVTVTLTLNKDEARTLAHVLGLVGGSPTDSPRRHVSPISSALRSVGFDCVGSLSSDWPFQSRNAAIWFKDDFDFGGDPWAADNPHDEPPF